MARHFSDLTLGLAEPRRYAKIDVANTPLILVFAYNEGRQMHASGISSYGWAARIPDWQLDGWLAVRMALSAFRTAAGESPGQELAVKGLDGAGAKH